MIRTGTFGLGLVLFCTVLLAEATPLYPFDTPAQQAQFTHLLRQLRCLVCQNQDLADSNAGLAQDLRDEVYQLVKKQQSDTEIVRYLTSRYGDFILFNPPVKAVTAFLWYGPAVFLMLGLFVFWRAVGKRPHDA